MNRYAEDLGMIKRWNEEENNLAFLKELYMLSGAPAESPNILTDNVDEAVLAVLYIFHDGSTKDALVSALYSMLTSATSAGDTEYYNRLFIATNKMFKDIIVNNYWDMYPTEDIVDMFTIAAISIGRAGDNHCLDMVNAWLEHIGQPHSIQSLAEYPARVRKYAFVVDEMDEDENGDNEQDEILGIRILNGDYVLKSEEPNITYINISTPQALGREIYDFAFDCVPVALPGMVLDDLYNFDPPIEGGRYMLLVELKYHRTGTEPDISRLSPTAQALARAFADFTRLMELQGNEIINTIFADNGFNSLRGNTIAMQRAINNFNNALRENGIY